MPNDDPTDLICKACGTVYRMNEPRVIKALLSGRTDAQIEPARLCWVCSHLRFSVRREEERREAQLIAREIVEQMEEK